MNTKNNLTIKDLISDILSKRKFIIRVTGIAVLFGFFFALTGQKEYMVHTSLLPNTDDSFSSPSSLLETFGGMAGLNLNFSQGQIISPELYPQIIHSTPFLMDILYSEVNFSKYGKKVSIYEYFMDYHRKSPLSYVKDFTIYLPERILGYFRKGVVVDQTTSSEEKENIIIINSKQNKLLLALKKRILIYVDDESGIISLYVEMPDPKASTEVANLVIKNLTDYIISYKTEKIDNELLFIEKQLSEAEKEFKKAQYDLAKFEDENLNLASSIANSRKRQLESNYNLKFSIYSSLAQQFEQTKIQKHRNIPVFKDLEPVIYPLRKSKPKRILIVISSFLIGFIGSSIYVLLKKYKSPLIQVILP
jgi:uncharacterized protein involved in exopolysaccharide biosynthesis